MKLARKQKGSVDENRGIRTIPETAGSGWPSWTGEPPNYLPRRAQWTMWTRLRTP